MVAREGGGRDWLSWMEGLNERERSSEGGTAELDGGFE